MTFDKIYLFSTFVAGREYYRADDVWRFLAVGVTLQLKYEEDNQHDPFAVAIYYVSNKKEYKLGYLPRMCNEIVGSILAMGWNDVFECVISRLDESAVYERQIGISVKVRNRECVLPGNKSNCS